MTVEAWQTQLARAVWILLAQLFVSLVAVAYVMFLPISIPHCELQCDFATLSSAIGGFQTFAAALMLISVAATVLLRKRGLWILVPPLAALVLVLVGAGVATHVSRVAMLF